MNPTTGFLKITKHVTVGDRSYAPGEQIEVGDIDLARRLLSMRAAVPSAGTGRILTTPTVREEIRK